LEEDTIYHIAIIEDGDPMQISLSGTVFTSYDVRTRNSFRDDTSFEEILQNIQQKPYETKIELSKDSSKTSFIDPVNGAKVSVSLENSTIEKLRDKFGTNSVIKDEIGNIELKDKAQDFVASWFADIAYTRGFLKADTNGDGILDEEEYKNTYNGLGMDSSIKFAKDDFIVKEEGFGYYKTDDVVYAADDKFNATKYNAYRTDKHTNSIDDELNHTLNLDKNFDGNITLQEAYEGESSIEKKVQEFLKVVYLDSYSSNGGYFEDYFSQALGYVLDIMENSEELDKDKWEQIRRQHYLVLDSGYLKLDLARINALDDDEEFKKLLKKLEESAIKVSKDTNIVNQNETTKEFLARVNIVDDKTEIYAS